MIKSAGKNHFIEIDSIRGLSAVIILLHHFTGYVYFVDKQEGWFLDFIEYGKYTLSSFFIISGLLIFMSLEKSKHPQYFLLSRFSRIYPAYWTCLILTTLVITFSPYFPEAPVTLSDFLANITLFQHWMGIRDIDTVYWTLAVEICFYFLIFLVFIFRKQKYIEQIGVAWLVLMVLVYVLAKHHMIPNINYYYYVPLLKNGDLFFAGILLYQLRNNPAAKRKYFLLLLAVLVHFIINPLDEAIAICITYLVLCLFVFDKLKFLRTNILYFFGYICYPLYLLHQYIGYETINFMNDVGVKSILLKILIPAILTTSLAAVVAITVERPAMKFFRKKFIPGKKEEVLAETGMP